MEVVEMLDNLKEKARRDPALREELLATREEKEPLAAFCRKCPGSWAFRFMRWILLRQARNFTQL